MVCVRQLRSLIQGLVSISQKSPDPKYNETISIENSNYMTPYETLRAPKAQKMC